MELLRRSLLTAALATTLPLAVTEAYARVPQLSTRAPPPSLPTPPSSTTFDTLVLVLHGAGGPDANTRRIAEALEAPSTLVVEYDYAACIGDQLHAA
jgi:poly(3-hydroxybutyrate) depolymerase